MRKTLIALILVLPMVFVLVLFSSVNLVSLNVNISVSDITIHADGTDEEGTLLVRMEEKREHIVTAEVSPSNASNKGYSLSSSDEKIAEVTREGKIVPKREGAVTITATSNDKSFTDSLSVVIVSSKPYDFDFSVYDGETDILRETEGGYTADIPAGEYSYGMEILPIGFSDYRIAQAGGYAHIEKGAKTLFLPFSGENKLEVSVPDGVNGVITKTVTLNVPKPPQGTIAVNGTVGSAGIRLVEGTKELQIFVECAGTPSFVSAYAHCKGAPTSVGNGQYILDVTIDGDVGETFSATISAGGASVPCQFTFTEFAFSVFSDLPIVQEGERQQVTLLTGNAVSFYAVSTGGAGDVEYTWEFEKLGGGTLDATFTADGAKATVSASRGGDYVLRARTERGGRTFEQEIFVSIVNKISAIQITNNVKVDLAECYTVAGRAYNSSMELQDNVYPLRVYAYSTSGTGPAGDDVAYSVSDDSIARVETRDGALVLVPLGTGKVTVTAYWKGNEAFSSSVAATLTLNVVKEGVAVKNAPELVKAAGEKYKVVLTDDIRLGTDAKGDLLSEDVRAALLREHRMRSTYNTAWYESSGNADGAFVSYVLEFFNDVYGNGKSVDADAYTHAMDGSGQPIFAEYRGPLYFVNYGQIASVAGQDNIAFLIRTNGVKLYGVDLLGCSDGSLKSENGEYDLTNLNLTGTTLEVNATAEIVNCRIRNGRNVIRAYGGNRDGQHYFLDSLSENRGCDSERILVRIEGCILSQGREFILKIGANRALRASLAGGAEPALTDQSGRPYTAAGKSNDYGYLYNDSWFYSQYVMTDVTLEDSVVETSGLFTVGVESNFAGTFLYGGAGDHQWRRLTESWERTGGTSFASVLRLKGDVRLYDWKDLSLVDSSTLIESPTGALREWLKLDIRSMLNFVVARNPERYGNVIERSGEKEYVHGGIALYGGGRNYSAVDVSELDGELNDLLHLNVNISVLADGEGTLHQQGTILPSAAGTQDFNFYMYDKNSKNNYAKQRTDEQNGRKYLGVSRLPLFVD